MVSGRRDLVYTDGRGGPMGVGDEVGNQVHCPMSGEGGAVGGPTATPGGL